MIEPVNTQDFTSQPEQRKPEEFEHVKFRIDAGVDAELHVLKFFRFPLFRLRCEILGVDRLNHFPRSCAFTALLNRGKQPNLMLARRSVLSMMSGMYGAQIVRGPRGQGW